MTKTPDPAAEHRAALILERAMIVAWEHRYECFDDPEVTARRAEIDAELAST